MNPIYPKPVSISAFFPAYNDGGTIASMVIGTLLVLEQCTDDFEIIIVNDGSADYTAAIADRLAEDYPRVRVAHHAKNGGYGAALRTGFASATKDLVFYTDGDAQYDARDLLKLLPLLRPDVDVVQGYKLNRDDPWFRRPLGRLYHALVRRLFRVKVRDVDCDFRLIRRRALETFELTQTSGGICVELIKKLELGGFRFVEAGVRHYPRPYGRSQFFRPRHLISTFIGLIRLWRELRGWQSGQTVALPAQPRAADR